MIKKILISLLLLILFLVFAAVTTVWQQRSDNEKAAVAEAKSFASRFARDISAATTKKLPDLEGMRDIAGGGPGIEILSWDGETISFRSISSPFLYPPGPAFRTLGLCYTAAVKVGRPVEPVEIPCR